MARYCPHCGRPKDKDHHDRSDFPHLVGEGPNRKGRLRRMWVCRVRRLADQTAPILRDARDGAPIESEERKVVRTFVPDPDVKQRTRENNLRSVPTALLKLRGN